MKIKKWIILLFLFVLVSCGEPTKKDNSNVDLVILEIDELSTTIHEDDLEYIDYVNSLYEGLTDEEKSEVTNYDKLELILDKVDKFINEEEYLNQELLNIKEELEKSIPNEIDKNINSIDLPKTYTYSNSYSAYNFKIEWTSSDENVITLNGNIIHKKDDMNVSLKAVISNKKIERTEKFEKTIKVKLTEGLDFDGEILVGYWYGKYSDLTEVDKKSLDIINYSFAGIDKDSKGNFYINMSGLSDIRNMKAVQADGIKLCISLGGWHDDSSYWNLYSEAASTEKNRKQVANSVLEVMREYGLDGIDMDWEYPTTADRNNFTLLMKEIYDTLKAESPKYIISIALPVSNTRFDLAGLNDCLDYFYVMTYDLDYGSSVTTHVSNLSYAEYAANFLATNGVDKKKIIIGSAFYGRRYTSTPGKNNGLGEKYSEMITISFTDIYKNYYSRIGKDVLKLYDKSGKAYYLFDTVNNDFISFECEESVQEKWNFACDNGYGGLMYWSYNNDMTNTLMTALYEIKEENK